MQNAGKSRKALIIGIIAAVVVLAIVLALVLTQCTGGTPAATTDPNATTGTEVPTYELYWNVDRAEYDGKSEAGLSSRMPESDGYFHVRFILDGEEVTLKVADRKLINSIDIKDLMGLEFDENGIVVNVLDLDDMPLEKLGWQFYVQSAAKTLIKLNSSESMNGMEVLLETNENTGVYDMTGLSGKVGVAADPMQMDRVYAIANLAGDVTHVFLYQRPNYMLTHEAECEHCKKTVTWYEWTKTDTVPLATGHYQLMNDIQLKSQPAQQEDAKVCIDLNGKRVDGANNSRCYAMFNAGTELAIMDTSEEQTGTLAAHGKGDQGMVVWVRYGAFYLYGGTLDASDAITKLNGTAVECGKGKFFYMHGGTIIGGTAEPQKNDKGNWIQGLGGAISLSGKMVMNGGEIRDGKAPAKITYKNGEPVYNRGYGGNIYMGSGAVLEMNGGVIKNGVAGNVGGNIMMDGNAELTINGGRILGGTISGKGKNGGSIFAGAKTKITLASGVIAGGTARNCAGNIYTNGDFIMTGGSVYGGTIRDFKTGKVVENASSANIFNVNGKLHLYGGKIDGYVQCIDTSATDNKDTSVYLTTNIIIDGGENCTRNLVLASDGGGITVRVGKMRDMARVGVYTTTGYFTLPTLEENKDNFFSDIEGADILYHDERLALGRMQCVCGSNSENVEDHLGACKAAGGEKVVFAPWLNTGSMPNLHGNYYLMAETLSVGNTSIVTPGDGKGTDVVVNVDLNGKQITSKSGRFYSLFENKVSQDENGNYLGNIADEHIELSFSDSVGGAKVTMNARTYSDMGFLVWGRYADSIITIYGGEYDGSAVSAANHEGGIINANGTLNIHGGHINGGASASGGIISARHMNMTDGIIENGKAIGHSGGNVKVIGTFNMSGGIIRGGSINADSTLVGDLAYGGNVCINGTMNMTGGIIENGVVKIGIKGTKPDGTAINAGGGLSGNIQVNGKAYLTGGIIRGGTAENGGNIGTNTSNSEIHLGGNVQVLDGVATGSGGNIAINVRSGKLLTIADNALVSGGNAAGNGGNVFVSAWVNNNTPVTINMTGGTVEKGFATKQGGNFYLSSTSGLKTYLNVSGGKILDGATKDVGGNIQVAGGSALTVSGGEIMGGQGNNGVYNPANNVYAVNAYAEFTGGKVEGFAATNTVANGNTVKISGNPQILPARGGNGISLGTWSSSGTPTFDHPYIELGTLTEGADITVGTWGYISTETAEANAKYIKASNAEVDTCYVDNRIFLGKVACICGGTANIGPCAEGGHKKVVWMPWNGKSGSITANGNYYLIQNQSDNGGQLSFGQDGRPTNISINLNGHSVSAGFRLLQLWNTAVLNIADHKGGGALLTKGNPNDNYGGIQMLGKAATVNFYSGKLGFAEGYKTHKEIALIEAAGTVNMYGGEIFGGVNPTGTLINVGGTFNMYGGTIRDGYNALISGTQARGGNFRVGGTLNVYGGTISGGKAQYGGNIAATGKVNLYGGTVKDGFAYCSNGYAQGGNIFMTGGSAKLNANGKVTVSGGKIQSIYNGNNNAWGPGGNIYANSGANVVLDGGAVVTGGNCSDGHNIYLTTAATQVTLKNCTVENTVSGSTNIAVEAGTLNVENGAMVKNTVAGSRNISANDSGSNVANINIKGGTVTGGHVTGGTNGGNIIVNGNDFLTISGGVVENGISENQAGNIVVHGTFTMTGGEVRNGKAKTNNDGYNIMITSPAADNKADVIISGGKIAGGFAFNNYYTTPNMTISGNLVIDKELATANKPDCSLRLSSADITVGTLTEGAKIMVRGTEGVFTFATGDGNDKYFGSDVAGYGVWQHTDKTLVYGRVSCICGSTDGNHIGECDGTKHNWMPTTSMPTTSGYYYLTSNVTDGGHTINGADPKADFEVYIDLNGKTVTSNGWRMYSLFDTTGNVKGNVTICDNSANRNGTIVLAKADRDQGALVWGRHSSHNITIYGGIFDATGTNNRSSSAGLVLSGVGTLKLFRGTIKGGTSSVGGSAVAFEGGKTHVLGDVEITGTGSAIYFTDNSKVDLTHVTKAPATPWAIEACGIFTKGWNSSWKIEDYFVSANEAGIYLDEATGELKMGQMHCVCGKSTHIGACDGTQLFWTPWRSGTKLPTTTGNYYLTRDVSNFGQHNITTDAVTDVKIDLAGHKATANAGARIYLVQKSNILTITDTVGGGVMAGGGINGYNSGGFLMQDTSVLNLYAGTLTESANAVTTTTRGGVLEINGTFNMYGGTVSGGVAQIGGNMWLSGTANITGGTITGGKAVHTDGYGCGGNIYVTGSAAKLNINGPVTVSNGTVSSSKAWQAGANIYVVSGANVTIDGGAKVIGGNAGTNYPDGHNIYMTSDNSVVTLRNCTIENTSTGSGNINMEKGTLNIEGATIKNTAAKSTNIRTNDNTGYVVTINMKSGTITGGTNANIVLGTEDILNISGGTITGGVSPDDGGNLYLKGKSKTTITGGTISSGVAALNGGNVFVAGNATVTMSGGKITSGRANNGGNLRVNGTLNLSGNALIEFGGATTGGDGIYGGGNIFSPYGSVVNMTGGTIRNGGKAVLTDGVWTADGAMDFGWTHANVLNEGTFTMSGGLITGSYSCWSNSKLNLSGDAKIYVEGTGLNPSGTVTIGKMNIGEKPSIMIFSSASAANSVKTIGVLAADVTYTEAELNKLFAARAWDEPSIQFRFYLDGTTIKMAKAN